MTQVSVIIPAYNASATLGRTLDTVRGQTHTNLEIIVVNDGSTDDTESLARRHEKEDSRIKVVSQSNAGVAAARNHGIGLASSEWVAPIDADDLWHPATIERFLIAVKNASSPVVFVYTWSRRIDAHDRLIEDLGRPRYAGYVLPQLIVTNFTRNASATLLNRKAAASVGGYDTSLQAAGTHGAEDIDLYLRLARLGPVAVADGFHVGYRQMPGTMSGSASRMRASIETVLQRNEQSAAGLNSRLFSLARCNYDLYAAGLSFRSRNARELLRYSVHALKRNPLIASVHLLLFGIYSLMVVFRIRKMPMFDTLEAAETASLPVADIVEFLKSRIYGRLTAQDGSER